MKMFTEVLLHVCSFILRFGKKLPQHVAFIPDNNRTFSMKNHIRLIEVYMIGQKKLFELLKWSVFLNISNISMYLFSTHNLGRNEYEKQCVYDAISIFLHTLLIEPMNCRFKMIGDVSQLPELLQELCVMLTNESKDNDGTLVNLALNYSGKEELVDVSYKILREIRQSELKIDTINDVTFNKFIYTDDSPDVDLLIRTSSHKRLSEFLLWQNIRSYLYYTDICWPEITKWHLVYAVFFCQYHHKMNKN